MLGTAWEGRKPYEVVNPGEFTEFLSCTRSIDSPGFFINVARKLIPNENEVQEIADSMTIRETFELTFAKQDQKTRTKILEALREKLYEYYDG